MLPKLVGFRVVLIGLLSLGLIAAAACAAEEVEETAAAPQAPAAPAAPVAAAVAAPAAPAAPAAAAAPQAAAAAQAAAAPKAPAAGAGAQVPAAAAVAAMPAPDAGTCYIIGELVSDCPPRSPHKWQPKPSVPGEYWEYFQKVPHPTSWYESPQSYQLVKAGVLPPLEERVAAPEDRVIFAPPNGIGEYGGGIRQTSGGAWWLGQMDYNTWTARDSDGITLHMFLGKSFDISEDGRVYTNVMRPGVRWSDGSLFTMEDVRFAWEDLNLNKELTPSLPTEYRDPVTGNEVKFDIIDGETWTLTFDTANFAVYELRSTQRQWCAKGLISYMCPSYLKQFHADYADPVELQAHIEANNLENWTQLYSDKGNIFANVDLPHMTPWGACVKEDELFRVCRNHYYNFFDPEGNQLPYVDEFEVNTFSWNREVAVFRAMNGENDVRGDMLVLSEMPLYNANLEKGDISLYLWPDASGLDLGLNLNLGYNEDPEIGRLIRTRDFRIALSLALNREVLNDSLFLGVGVIQGFSPHPSTPYFPGKEVAQMHMDFNPTKANELLDAILPDKDSEGFRLRTDNGKRLTLLASLQPAGFAAPYDPLFDLIQPMWADVGIDLTYTLSSNANTDYLAGTEYLSQRNGMGFYQANMWSLDDGQVACMGPGCRHAPAIGLHAATQGEKGLGVGADSAYLPLAPADTYPIDVSGNLKKGQDLFKEGKAYTRFDPRRIEIAKELLTIWATEMYGIPIAGFTGSFRGMQMKRNNLLNVPRHHTSATSGYRTDTYFFEGGKDNKHHPGNRSKSFKGTTFLGGG